MASFFVDIDETYTAADSSRVISLDISIGDGQDGGYLVFLNNKFIGANRECALGKGADIKGQKSLTSVTITDELQETNWTSCTLNIYEDSTLIKSLGPYKKLVPDQQDTVIFSINIYHQ